jgi:hypothetical protein
VLTYIRNERTAWLAALCIAPTFVASKCSSDPLSIGSSNAGSTSHVSEASSSGHADVANGGTGGTSGKENPGGGEDTPAQAGTGAGGPSGGSRAADGGSAGGGITVGGSSNTGAGEGGADLTQCSPTEFVSSVVSARATSNAPSGCISPFSLATSESVRQATAKFVSGELGVSATSLSVSPEPCGSASMASCANVFDVSLGALGGNLMSLIHPLSIELETCDTVPEVTTWTATASGTTTPTVACLAGQRDGHVTGMCAFASRRTCSP